MLRRMLGTACLLASLTADADGERFMSLRWGGTMAGQPEAFGQLSAALSRYPSCFDSILSDGKLDAQAVEALRKMGLAVDKTDAGLPPPTTFFDDHAPRGMIGSALLFDPGSPQNRAALDNRRHCLSGKSAHGLCVESMLYLAFGAERLSYDLLSYAHEPVAWYANTYMSELTLWRPFYQAYVRYNQGTKPGGILPFCGKSGKPDLSGTLRAANALAPSGFPVCPGSPWPVCYLLNAESVDSMSAVDIQRVLSGGVILDGGAAARLQARGFGAAMMMAAHTRPPDVREVFTDDELNFNRVNYVWQPDATGADTYAFTPSNETARVIGRYQTPDGRFAEACSVLTETATGGRMAAFGVTGFSAEMSAARQRQVLLAADWVAQNRLPVFVETASQVMVVPRVTLAGDLRSVTVLNASLDVQQPVTLRLRGCLKDIERMDWVTPKDKPVTLPVRWEQKDVLVVLPAIGPWQIGWLRAEGQ